MPIRLKLFFKRVVLPLIGSFIFLALAYWLYRIAPSKEISIVLVILVLTIYLFLFEVLLVDVTAITIMVLLGLISWQFTFFGMSRELLDISHLFDGFASNAVMSIVAVMIIGASLDKTGMMASVANIITKIGGSTEKRISPIISFAVAIISSFMQNVGAAALFLPVTSRIANRTEIPLSRLLMPMGFCAICGGTVTMVGSSPLILLNDLIINSNKSLPADQQIEPFSLFSVTPIGLAIVAAAIAYFLILGKFILPSTTGKRVSSRGTLDYIRKIYGVNFSLNEIAVPAESPLIGMNIQQAEKEFAVRIIALHDGTRMHIAPGALSRKTEIMPNNMLAIMASDYALNKFVELNELDLRPAMQTFAEALTPTRSGMSEIVLPPSSELIGKTPRELSIRTTYGLTLLVIYRDGENLTDISDEPFHSGDTMIAHSPWEVLQALEDNRDFVILTDDYPRKEDTRPKKLIHALVFFGLALFLVIFTDLRLSVALLTGAVGMILSGVISIDEAYDSVSWKTVFLLASLIPLGIAVENSGTADWIADRTLNLIGDVPDTVLLAVIAILSTFFTLVMSNVGATVLLVPLAINIAIKVGANPAVFAITVALATSNSFIIPTHQVNALLMGPGGYTVADYLKAGGIMTVLFLVVMLFMVNLIF